MIVPCLGLCHLVFDMARRRCQIAVPYISWITPFFLEELHCDNLFRKVVYVKSTAKSNLAGFLCCLKAFMFSFHNASAVRKVVAVYKNWLQVLYSTVLCYSLLIAVLFVKEMIVNVPL